MSSAVGRLEAAGLRAWDRATGPTGYVDDGGGLQAGAGGQAGGVGLSGRLPAHRPSRLRVATARPQRVQANDASLLPRPRGPPAAFDWVAGTGERVLGALRQEHQNRAGSSTTDVTSRSWELRAPHAPFRPNPPTQRPQISPTCARCIPFPSVLPALERALRQTLPPAPCLGSIILPRTFVGLYLRALP